MHVVQRWWSRWITTTFTNSLWIYVSVYESECVKNHAQICTLLTGREILLQICTQMPIFSQITMKLCKLPPKFKANNACMLNCIYMLHCEKRMSFQSFFCYLSFRWVSMLHAWTVNSVNRLFKNAIIHSSNHLFIQLVCIY